MGSKNRFYLYILAMIVFGLVNFTANFAQAASLTDTAWQFRLGEQTKDAQAAALCAQSVYSDPKAWETFSYPSRPPVENDTGYIWLTTTLPDVHYGNPVLFFTTLEESVRVYLDDVLLYQYGDMEYKRYSYGMKWHIVELPDGYEGRHLTFQLYTSHPGRLGVFERLTFDNGMRQMLRLFEYDAMYVMALPATILMFLIIFVYYTKARYRSRLYGYTLGFFSLFALWLVAASNTKLWFFDWPVFWWYALMLSIYTMPILANLIVYEVIEPETKAKVKGVLCVYGLLGLLAVGGEFLGFGSMDYLLTAFYLSLLICQIVVAWLLMVSAYRGNQYSKTLLVAVFGIPVFAVYDGLSAHFKLLPWTTHLTPLGIFTFIFFILQILTENVRKENELEEKVTVVTKNSQTDTLTKCFNRMKFNEIMEARMNMAVSDIRPLAMFMLDLDFFKRVNDTYGHDAGDEVLFNFAETVRGQLNESNVFIRYGGEEFLVICFGASLESAAALAETVRQAVESAVILKEETITCSIGVSQWHIPIDNGTLFLKRADMALYQAKKSGRNKVVTENELPVLPVS